MTMKPLTLYEMLSLHEAAGCPRRDRYDYLADCLVRQFIVTPPTQDMIITAGIGILRCLNGVNTFEVISQGEVKRLGFGDKIERIINLIPGITSLPCHDQKTKQLKPESGCA